jgi:hypothetical protein
MTPPDKLRGLRCILLYDKTLGIFIAVVQCFTWRIILQTNHGYTVNKMHTSERTNISFTGKRGKTTFVSL